MTLTVAITWQLDILTNECCVKYYTTFICKYVMVILVSTHICIAGNQLPIIERNRDLVGVMVSCDLSLSLHSS